MICPKCHAVTVPHDHPVCLACGTRMDEPSVATESVTFREPMADGMPSAEPESAKTIADIVETKPIKGARTK